MTTFALLVLLLAAPASSARDVARVGSHKITYDSIRCRPGAFVGKPLPPGTDAGAFCRQVEQQTLDRIILGDLLDVAARQYKLEPTEAELPPPPGVDVVAAARRYDIVARALLDKMAGATDAAIRAKWLQPNGITTAEFQTFAASFRTPEEVRRYLAQDNAKLMRQSLNEQKRRELILDRLRSRVAVEASRSGRPVATVAAETWAELLRAAAVEILDPAFQLPSMKGVVLP